MDVKALQTAARPGSDARDEQVAAFNQAGFGAAMRRLRLERGWTLRDLSERTNVSQSALSRAETGQITLSFDRVHAIAHALGVEFTQMLKQLGPERREAAQRIEGWRSYTRRGEGQRILQKNTDYEYVCADYLYKKMVTGVATVRATSMQQHGPFVSHEGEEFLHVLEGSIVIATTAYAPLTLAAGDAFQFDSAVPHAIYSATRKPARVLFCVTDPRRM